MGGSLTILRSCLSIGLLVALSLVRGTSAAAPLPSGVWQPTQQQTFQLQLDGAVSTNVPAAIYDLDLFDTSTATVRALHRLHRRVICYFSAGSYENWRPDAARFPPKVIGRAYAGWAGEWWLNIQRIDLLAPIMTARLHLCKTKGFDGADPDNVDGYENATGFPLTAHDQVRFNRWLAALAHQTGLAVGLKNDGDQAAALVPQFQWMLTEDCFAQNACGQTAPFLRTGKPVFAVEYTDLTTRRAFADNFCSAARRQHITLILKDRGLGAWRLTCPSVHPSAG